MEVITREKEDFQVPEGKERESDPENWLISKNLFSFFVSLMKNPQGGKKERMRRMKTKKVDQKLNWMMFKLPIELGFNEPDSMLPLRLLFFGFVFVCSDEREKGEKRKGRKGNQKID